MLSESETRVMTSTGQEWYLTCFSVELQWNLLLLILMNSLVFINTLSRYDLICYTVMSIMFPSVSVSILEWNYFIYRFVSWHLLLTYMGLLNSRAQKIWIVPGIRIVSFRSFVKIWLTLTVCVYMVSVKWLTIFL